MTRAEWIKDAESGILEAEGHINKTAAFDWDLDDDTRKLLIKALLGGAVGAGVMGAGGAMTAGPGESGLARALRYGALGGAGGSALTAAGAKAYDLLTGGRQLEGETGGTRPVTDRAADSATSSALRNPLLTLGLGVGAVGATKGLNWSDAPLIGHLGGAEQDEARKAAKKVLENWKLGRDAKYTASGGGKALNPIQSTLNKLKSVIPGFGHNMALSEASKRGLTGHSVANTVPKKLWLAALPAAALAGWLGDRYLRGDYE